jgi:hypothetical protein
MGGVTDRALRDASYRPPQMFSYPEPVENPVNLLANSLAQGAIPETTDNDPCRQHRLCRDAIRHIMPAAAVLVGT